MKNKSDNFYTDKAKSKILILNLKRGAHYNREFILSLESWVISYF